MKRDKEYYEKNAANLFPMAGLRNVFQKFVLTADQNSRIRFKEDEAIRIKDKTPGAVLIPTPQGDENWYIVQVPIDLDVEEQAFRKLRALEMIETQLNRLKRANMTSDELVEVKRQIEDFEPGDKIPDDYPAFWYNR